MITFPCCKINLGLNITARRPDGYHDLETVFYPVPLCDALSIKRMDEAFPSPIGCDIKVSYSEELGSAPLATLSDKDNLVVKAYDLLARDYRLPRLHAHLYKQIPSQAGLGGGSSDAAFMIKLIDEYCHLNIGNAEMERYAAMLGADCAFFIAAEPAFATGKGEQLSPADAPSGNLRGYHLALVKPSVAVSTAEAYASITPRRPEKCCRDIVRQPINTWRDELTNDFEEPIFKLHPVLGNIKQRLYDLGAAYSQMSGSGSTVFGIFKKRPTDIASLFPDCFTAVVELE